MEEENASLVIDFGSYSCKCGFSGDEQPMSGEHPSIVGKPFAGDTNSSEGYYFGNEAINNHENFELISPVRNSEIVNWNSMELLWHNIFYKNLRISPEEHPVFLTSKMSRYQFPMEKTTSIMFENFNVPALYIQNCPSLCALYSSGRTLGMIVNIGDGVNTVTPIFYDYILSTHTIKTSKVSGLEITKYVADQLKTKLGLDYDVENNLYHRHVIHKFKEECVEVSLDQETRSDNATNYELLDGTRIDLTNLNLHEVSEILFKSSNKKQKSVPLPIHEMIIKSIGDEIGGDNPHSPSNKQNLYSNIVLAGGTTCMKYFDQRLEKEVKDSTPCRHARVKVSNSSMEDRKFGVWKGASIMSSLKSFQFNWVTKDEYEDAGASITLRKCCMFRKR